MDEAQNDLVDKVARRARELADMKIDTLRSTAGYGCETRTEAIRVNKGRTRGELIEIVLIGQFYTVDSPR